MTRLRVLICASFSLVGLVTATAAAFSPDDYKPGNLAQPYAFGEKECGKIDKNEIAVATGNSAFRVSAVWNGEKRPTPDRMKALLYFVEKTRGIKFDLRTVFGTEVKVTDEAGRDYWLPIQAPIFQAFKDEVGPVKRATLYVAYFGCMGEQIAVVVNEFQAGQN